MTSGAAVGVDDDLAAGQPGVAHRSTDDEPTSRVDEHLVVVVGELLGDDGTDHLLDEVGTDLGVAVDAVVVLGRDQDRLQRDGLAVAVLERDLGLAVRAQVGNGPGLANLGEALGHAMRQMDRSGMRTSVSSHA